VQFFLSHRIASNEIIGTTLFLYFFFTRFVSHDTILLDLIFRLLLLAGLINYIIAIVAKYAMNNAYLNNILFD